MTAETGSPFNGPASTEGGGVVSTGRIDGWRDAADRFRAAMAMLAARPADVWVADVDGSHWPLGERVVMEAWQQWALQGGHRHLVMVAARFDTLPLRHPRWMAWRTTWGHRVRCLQAPDALKDHVQPLLIVGTDLALKVTDLRHGTGLWSRDPARIEEWRSELDVISQRSTEGLPSTILGL